jgi:hypothetical protein
MWAFPVDVPFVHLLWLVYFTLVTSHGGTSFGTFLDLRSVKDLQLAARLHHEASVFWDDPVELQNCQKNPPASTHDFKDADIPAISD